MENHIQILYKYQGNQQQKIRIIADAVLIYSMIGRLENHIKDFSGVKATIEKYSFSLFWLADLMAADAGSDSSLSDVLLDAFFEYHENGYDFKDYSEEYSELVTAEIIFLKWEQILQNAKKNRCDENKD